MAQTTEQGVETPTLYSFYGDQYNYNDLARKVDSGLDDYISTLKKGKKYGLQIKQAVTDIMTGMKDGTVTFEDGRYNDSLGRYRNAEDKDKDIYGWAASYIYDNMCKIKKYVAPQDTSKKSWSNKALSKALVKDIFNSNQPNIDYFVDQDQADPNTHTRKTDTRARMIADWIDTNVNEEMFNGYTGYTDEDKQNYLRMAKEASTKLRENGADPGDYLFLSRVLPGIPWEELFRTTDTQPAQPTQTYNPYLGSSNGQPVQPIYNGFNNYLDQNWARKPNDSGEFSTASPGITYGNWTRGQILSAVNGADYNTILNYLGTAIDNPTREFGTDPLFRRAIGATTPHITSQVVVQAIISRLAKEGKLIQDPNNSSIWYIPDLLNKKTNSGYYYNSNTKTIHKKSVRDIPYWQYRLQKEYYKNVPESQFSTYFTTAQFKKGGIIKAKDGDVLWYSGLTDYEGEYEHAYDTSKLINPDLSDSDSNPWVAKKQGSGSTRYLGENERWKDRAYNQGIENTQYYKDFGNALLNPDGTFTDVGLAWAKSVDALLPKGSEASFFDENNQLRGQWGVADKNDIYDRPGQVYTKLDEYVNHARNDQMGSARHNVFLNTGKRYFYKDKDGVKHWVDPKEVSKYQVSDNPDESSGWNADKTVYWNDYELTGLKQEAPQTRGISLDAGGDGVAIDAGGDAGDAGDAGGESSSVYGVNGQAEPGGNAGSTFGMVMQKLAPSLLDVGRLATSLRTNNKVAKVLDRSLKSFLRNTPERYSPVTGATREKAFLFRQAAAHRGWAERHVTSDPYLQLAMQMDADRQARELEYQGFLADDKEIRRTKEEALKRQEDNMARRSEEANFNRKSINKTNREKAELEAARLQHNWASVDNFLKGQKEELTSLLAQGQEASQYAAKIDHDYYLQALNDKYKEINPDATVETMMNDPEYIKAVTALNSRYKQDLYGIGMGRIMRTNKDAKTKSYDDILKSISVAKHGGRLRPSITAMINKVMSNESYT